MAGLASDHARLSYSVQPAAAVAPFLTSADFDRLMTQLGGNPEKVKAAASLMLTAPGAPFVYYGEEVGLEGEKYELARRPMQWSADAFAGFSTGSPWAPLGPNWGSFNVAAEVSDPASILSHFRALIQARNQHAALRVGDLSVLTTGNDGLYGILRVSQHEAVLVLVNLTPEPLTDYRLALEASRLAAGSYAVYSILGGGTFAPLTTDSGGGFSQYAPVFPVPPYATFVLQLQPGGAGQP